MAQTVTTLVLNRLEKMRAEMDRGIEFTRDEVYYIVNEIINLSRANYPKRVNEIRVEGWKGKNSYEIYKGVDNVFRVTEFRQDKVTGEIKETTYEVEPDKINFLLSILEKLTVGKHYYAKYFWAKILKHYKIKLDIDAFNGGKYRARYYFPTYMHPLKAIEASGIIKIVDGWGGGLVRLK